MMSSGLMKKIWPIMTVILFIMIIGSSGCFEMKDDKQKYLDQIKENGSGNVISEERNVSGLDVISFSDNFFQTNFIIKQGKKDSLTIKAEDNIMPHIKTVHYTHNVTEPFFSIKYDANMPKPTKPITFYITVKKLNKLWIAGAGTTNITDINSENAEITLDVTNANINNIHSNNLTTRLNTGTQLNATGEVKNQNLEINGNCIYDGKKLIAQKVMAIISSGKATVNVIKFLNVTIIKEGQLTYIGNPQVIKQVPDDGKIFHQATS